MSRYKWIKGRRYYYYDSFNSWRDAYNVARSLQRKNKKNKYFIEVCEVGYLFPYKKYKLYTTKFARIGFY